MGTAQASSRQLEPRARPLGSRVSRHLLLTPGLLAVALMVLWAEHDGGYDADTWYWGALLLLGLLAATVVGLGALRPRLSRSTVLALGAFSSYTAWSYLSITWAATPGSALQGANRTLLYLLLFTLLVILPWTPEAALGAVLLFVLGVGAVGLVILTRLATGDHVEQLVVQGRLIAPTGYFNSSAALFLMVALLGVALAARRELPVVLRGTLIAVSGAALQLCVLGQSRGWLFTLPLVLLVVLALVPDRLRFAAAATIPLVAAFVPIRLLLDVFHGGQGATLQDAAGRVGRACLLICGVALVAGTAIAWWEARAAAPRLSKATRRWLEAGICAFAIAGAGAGFASATHGHPLSFISRQFRGFAQVQSANQVNTTHFAAVGSGRYDFWRVSLEAFSAHPIGGLGQDNFADYYVAHRQTVEEPSSPHSLEMSLLAETGLVGFGLVTVFLVAAVAGALRARRTGPALARGLAAAALLPFVVWLIHGSVDWFWEMPALSGPALAFLAIAGALARWSDAPVRRAVPSPSAGDRSGRSRAGGRSGRTELPLSLGARGLARAAIFGSPTRSWLSRISPKAAELNPLSPDPGRIGGTIALQAGRYSDAERRFAQATAREPGGWFAWFGGGLAASAMGNSALARRDFAVAASINRTEPVVRLALRRVDSARPLSPADALSRLVIVQ